MNNMRRYCVLLNAGILLFIVGCTVPKTTYFHPPPVESAAPWTAQEFKNDPNDFQFAIISDRTGGLRPGIFKEGIAKANMLQPEFVLCVGDLIEGYTEDRRVLDQQYGEMDDILSSLDMRFFRVVGNHDISNSVMLEMYKERYGLPYYHFIYKNVLFLIVSTEDADEKGRISRTQIEYMQKAISDNQNVRWTFVFMHKPVFSEIQGELDKSWTQIENSLVDRPHTVFAGHWHTYGKRVKHGQAYIQLGTTGGRSRFRGIEHGDFDHIVWVTMTDNGPSIVNLMLDGIYDDNVRLME